jgi:hypothetical protein
LSHLVKIIIALPRYEDYYLFTRRYIVSPDSPIFSVAVRALSVVVLYCPVVGVEGRLVDRRGAARAGVGRVGGRGVGVGGAAVQRSRQGLNRQVL